MNPPSSSTESPQRSEAHSSDVQRVVQVCAADCDTQADFLRRLATELIESFSVAIVAVESKHWTGPMMLVDDESLGNRINRLSICDLLATAAVVPIASDVLLQTPMDDGTDRTRALRVELTDSPNRAAILLVYSPADQPTATDQLQALKLLNEYTGEIRDVIASMPGDQVTRELTISDESSESIALALRARQSLAQFHRDLDVNATAYRVANESRRLLKCDRTTVLVPHGNKFKVRAMSGVAVVDSRSNSVKSIEKLAERASVMSRPMIMPSDEPLPPQIQEPLDEYLDETGVMTTVILPLYEPDHEDTDDGLDAKTSNPFQGHGRIVAMMFLEYFSGDAPSTIGPGTSIVASEAMYSLRNAQEHRNVFGLGLWKSIGKLTHSGKFPWIAAGFACFMALLIASSIIKVEHHVIATGSVEPSDQRQVFSTVDGVVKTIHVQDGQKVKAGEPLFLLENADLESRAESLSGEIMTASKRLSSVQALRLGATGDANQSSRLALEERQLQSELNNLRAQQELIRKQQDELLITSPIDGTVVGWQLERRLSDRPVTRGNLLVRVVDHAGNWSLKLNVPDYEAGPVLNAIDESSELPVRFAVATAPESSHAASLKSMATAARMNEAGEHVIDATASVELGELLDTSDADQHNEQIAGGGSIVLSTSQGDLDPFDPNNTRVGADVTARIACGKRSVLRSWFSDVFDFANRNIMFYFR